MEIAILLVFCTAHYIVTITLVIRLWAQRHFLTCFKDAIGCLGYHSLRSCASYVFICETAVRLIFEFKRELNLN